MKRLNTRVIFAVAGALVLALSGCATPASTTADETTGSDCSGIQVVVDYARLDQPTVDECVESAEPMTALEAATEAGLTITGSDKYGDAIVCRIDGRPSATEELRTETQGPYTETCADLGPGWAIWSIWVSTEAGWELGQEAVNTQLVKPGQAVGFVWQLTDSTEMDAWQTPNV